MAVWSEHPGQGYNTVVVLGPTASGKTRLGVHLAKALGGEVLSADSRQVYRGLNLGAGKDLDEYVVDGHAIPYHLIDIAGLDQEFSVFDYQRRFFEAFAEVMGRGAWPVVVGGTGLYLEAALCGYRMVEAPENPRLRADLEPLSDAALATRLLALKGRLHNTTDLTDRGRLIRAIEIAEHARGHEPPPGPDIRPLLLGVQWTRAELRGRILVRLHERLARGMVAEVDALHDQGVPWERLERLGLEYRFLAGYLQSETRDYDAMVQKLYIAICQFAKRQDTWFRRMERQGAAIHWIPRGEPEAALDLVRNNLARGPAAAPGRP